MIRNVDPEYKDLYDSVIERIRSDRAIANEALNLWFRFCGIVLIDRGTVTLGVENESRKKSILTHYEKILEKYFSEELGRDVKIEIVVASVSAPSEKEDDPDDDKIFRRPNNYTFDNFVVGSSNAFACAAAKSIAQKPSMEFNPFFVYGPSGIGKTHLLYAIANKILETHPEKVIIFLKGEDFTNAYRESLDAGTMSLFRQKYRNADVLIIDDIQFIAGKKQTQEEFFHTFETLHEKKKQIILSSDRSPNEMAVLEERLKTRFLNGLIQDIQTPDLELRLAILRKKSENAGLRLSDEILEFLADKLHANIREIEGVIKKLSAMYFLGGVEIDMNTVKSSVSVFLKEEEPPNMIVTRIIAETGKKYDIPVDEILGRKRDKQIQNARNVSMYIIRSLTDLSLPEIGLMFDRKYTTVLSNIETVKKKIESDVYLEKQIDDIKRAVKG